MESIFLIEPDYQIASSISKLLTASGYRLQHFYNAEAAITAMENQPPTALIVNIDLPKHTGLEFIYEVSGYDDWQAVPIIIISSHVLGDDALGRHLTDRFSEKTFYIHKSNLSELAKMLEQQIPAIK